MWVIVQVHTHIKYTANAHLAPHPLTTPHHTHPLPLVLHNVYLVCFVFCLHSRTEEACVNRQGVWVQQTRANIMNSSKQKCKGMSGCRERRDHTHNSGLFSKHCTDHTHDCNYLIIYGIWGASLGIPPPPPPHSI